MTQPLPVSRPRADTARRQSDPPAAPRLYLSSAGAGWDGLAAEAFHEPPALEGWTIPASRDISLIVFAGGGLRLEQRHPGGPWTAVDVHQGDLILRAGTGAAAEARWRSLSAAPVRTLHLRLSGDLIARAAAELAGADPARLSLVERAGFRDPLLAQIGFALWHELEQRAPAGALYAHTAAHLLAVHLLRRYSSLGPAVEAASRAPACGLTPRQLRRVTDFVQAHLEHPLPCEALARQAGYSPSHFARAFRATTGESPHQFVLRQRVERARQLLDERDLPLAEVALASGFANQSHFTRVFKHRVGTTPRAYRREHAPDADA
jgi:AraC family transcriptional regulator